MPVFAYQGRDKQGNHISGTVEAPEQRVAVRQLLESGYFITDMRPQAAATPPPSATSGGPIVGIGPRDLSIFFRDIYQMLHAGIALAKTFDFLSQNSANGALRRIAKAIAPELAHGKLLSGELGKYPNVFTPLIVGLITAGESGGFLDRTCLRISEYLEKEHELRQRLSRETFYPKLVIAVGVLVNAVVAAAPTVTTGGFWPAFFKYLLGTLASLALPVGILTGIWLILRLRVGGAAMRKGLDDLKLLIPVVGNLVRKIALAKFCRALAALYSAGMGFGRSLQLAADACGNEGIAGFVRSRIPLVEQGGRLSEIMRHSSYSPPLVINMLATGEETGDLDGSLNKVADYYELESETALRMATRLIGVVALLTVAGMVAFRVIRFYTGLYSGLIDAI